MPPIWGFTGYKGLDCVGYARLLGSIFSNLCHLKYKLQDCEASGQAGLAMYRLVFILGKPDTKSISTNNITNQL
jgi:hypothetical protein